MTGRLLCTEGESPIRPRTDGEREAYLQGFIAGTEAALREVNRVGLAAVVTQARGRLGEMIEPLLMAEQMIHERKPGDPS